MNLRRITLKYFCRCQGVEAAALRFIPDRHITNVSFKQLLELLDIRSIRKRILITILLFGIILGSIDYNVIFVFRIRIRWWNGYSIFGVIENVLIPILLFIVLYFIGSGIDFKSSYRKLCLYLIVLGALGVFSGNFFGFLLGHSGGLQFWVNYIEWAAWRTLIFTPKIVFTGVAALALTSLNEYSVH